MVLGLKDRRLVAVDVETTGLDPESDEIIEVAAVAFEPQREQIEYASLVKPTRPVPPQISCITGISQEMLDDAPDIETVLRELLPLLDGAVIVAHNAGFDLAFLMKAASNCGMLPRWREVIDTLELSRIALPTLRSHKLEVLVSHLGVERKRSHRALDDARAEVQLFFQLKRALAELGPELLGELLELTGDCDWPLQPLLKEALLGAITRDGTGVSVSQPRGSPESELAVQTGMVDVSVGLEALLGRNGLASRVIPDFEFRPGQLQMAYLAMEAFREGKHVVVEAGTGSGKSLGYLLPAFLWALQGNAPVVVSTHTINLQEQLVGKDVPIVERLLGRRLNVAVVKGRNNYLCLRRWSKFREKLPAMMWRERRSALPLLCWASKTSTGDRSETHFLPEEEEIWKQVCSDSKDCLGTRCAFRGSCFAQRAREEAEQAHVIITNHALLFSDLASGNRVLPEYRYLVVDEAHHLEEAATKALGGSVSVKELSSLLATPILHRLQGVAGLASQALEELKGISLIGFSVGEPGQQTFLAGGHPMAERARGLIYKLDEVSDALMALAKDAPDEEQQLELMSVSLTVSEKARVLEQAIAQDQEDLVGWVEVTSGGGDVVFGFSPLWVGELLYERLFSRLSGSVLTSATLAVGGGFDGFLRSAGLTFLPPEKLCVETVVSPFDYQSQCLLCLVTDIVPPAREGIDVFTKDASAMVKELCELCNGRTVVLFTSHAMMKQFERELRKKLASKGINLLCQGVDGSRAMLMELFPRMQPCVIFGTSSFWEGVDLPERCLKCVVIVKLPFDVPDTPLLKARARWISAAGGNPFSEMWLPSAVIKFKQGFGRLIRRRGDRGVVVVLDSRLVTSSYGQVFLQSLPNPAVVVSHSTYVLQKVKEWLEQDEGTSYER